MVPDEWKEKHLYLEFEGVYKNSTVSINGVEIGGRSYGYVPFLVKLDKGLKYGQENMRDMIRGHTRHIWAGHRRLYTLHRQG